MSVNSGQHGPGTQQPPAVDARPSGEELPLTISHAEMDEALERGIAFPVAPAIGWLMRHRGAWWVIYEEGWLRLIKSTVTDQIDQLYPRLAEAEAQAAAEAARNRQRSRSQHRDEG